MTGIRTNQQIGRDGAARYERHTETATCAECKDCPLADVGLRLLVCKPDCRSPGLRAFPYPQIWLAAKRRKHVAHGVTAWVQGMLYELSREASAANVELLPWLRRFVVNTILGLTGRLHVTRSASLEDALFQSPLPREFGNSSVS